MSVVQAWQPYQGIKLIWSIWRDKEKGKKDKEAFEENITTLEVFIEAVPQIYIKLVLFGRERRLKTWIMENGDILLHTLLKFLETH